MSMSIKEEAAYAKVNLTLSVGGRRSDGYHELASLVVFVELADWLRLDEDLTGMEIVGEFAAATPPNNGESLMENSLMRALKFLGKERCGVWLEKNIPPRSGLGGGSADAAALLRAAGYSGERAALFELGADVPACFLSRALWLSGAGEKTEIIPPLPPLWCVLIKKRGVNLSTGEIFECLDERERDEVSLPVLPLLKNNEDIFSFCHEMGNDLEAVALTQAPILSELLSALRQTGAGVAGMTGSGSACFGLYATAAAAERAAAALKRQPDCWLWCGKIRGLV